MGERESTVCSPDGNFVCAFEGYCDLSDFLYLIHFTKEKIPNSDFSNPPFFYIPDNLEPSQLTFTSSQTL